MCRRHSGAPALAFVHFRAEDFAWVRGAPARYRVSEVAVVDQGEARVLDFADTAQLTLITCFPFDAIQPGTRQRYVVIAHRVA